jgi:hypothetical protein
MKMLSANPALGLHRPEALPRLSLMLASLIRRTVPRLCASRIRISRPSPDRYTQPRRSLIRRTVLPMARPPHNPRHPRNGSKILRKGLGL